MTINDLQSFAADLYKKAEEAVPVIGGADKTDWIARRLEEIIDQKEPVLNCLLGFDSREEVMDLMEKEYEDRKDPDAETDLPCATMGNQNQNDVFNENKMDDLNSEIGNVPIIIEEEIIIIEDIDPRTVSKECR